MRKLLMLNEQCDVNFNEQIDFLENVAFFTKVKDVTTFLIGPIAFTIKFIT